MARSGLLFSAAAFSLSFIAALTSLGPAFGEASRKKNEPEADGGMTASRHSGLWITGDGHVRHELLANGRYIEARGTREKAYEGRYQVSGDHIDYQDDTGFVADGDVKDGILYHAGMVLYRRDN
jgi:hypothetical protein